MAADGLHNITGRVNPSGTVTIWAITSTVSGGGDQGADRNKLVEITDPLNAARPATGENFRTIRTAGFGEMLWGVWFTRGSGTAARRLQFGGAGHIPRFQHGFARARRAGNSIYRTGRGARLVPGATRPWPTGGDGAGADGTTAACRW